MAVIWASIEYSFCTDYGDINLILGKREREGGGEGEKERNREGEREIFSRPFMVI